MQITTKFDIGQEVSGVYYCDMSKQHRVIGSGTITVIKIYRTTINYCFCHCEWQEPDVFPTRAEAEAEANRRNDLTTKENPSNA